MARLNYTAFLAGASGKLAGSTFAGKVIRTRSNFSCRRTRNQQIFKAAFIKYRQMWSHLSVSDRNSWIYMCKDPSVYGSAFAPGYRTPINLFCQVNFYRSIFGYSDIITAPGLGSDYKLTAWSIDPAPSSGQMLYRIVTAGTGSTPVIFTAWSGPSPVGSQYYKKRNQLLTLTDFTFGGTFNAAGIYTSVYGSLPVVGSKVWATLRCLDSNWLRPTKILLTSGIAR